MVIPRHQYRRNLPPSYLIPKKPFLPRETIRRMRVT
jgi:hypothetical protein